MKIQYVPFWNILAADNTDSSYGGNQRNQSLRGRRNDKKTGKEMMRMKKREEMKINRNGPFISWRWP